MEVKRNQLATLWNGEQGMVLSTTENSANIKLTSGKRVHAAFDQIVGAVDTFTAKEAKFLNAKDKLAAYKKKTVGPVTAATKQTTEDKQRMLEAANQDGSVLRLKLVGENSLYIGVPETNEEHTFWVLYSSNEARVNGEEPVGHPFTLDEVDKVYDKISDVEASKKYAPGKVDEPKWKKAEEAIAKSTGKSKSDFGDSEWAQVNSVYQNMGGKFHKKESSSKTAQEKTAFSVGDIVKYVRGTQPAEVIEVLYHDVLPSYEIKWLDNGNEVEAYEDDLVLVKKASNKTAGLTGDAGDNKYPVDTILVPEDAKQSPEHGYIRVLAYDPKEEVYTLSKRLMNEVEEDDRLQGVRFEMSKKELEGDKTLRVFSSKVTAIANFDANAEAIAMLNIIPTDDERLSDVSINIDATNARSMANLVILAKMQGGEGSTSFKQLVALIARTGGSTDTLEKTKAALKDKFGKTASIEEGKPSELVSVAASGDNIRLSFKEFFADYTKAGALVSTSATEGQFKDAYKKEFGLMVKNFGFEKLNSMVMQRRIASKLTKLSAGTDAPGGYYVMSKGQSVGWYKTKEEADKAAAQANVYGGVNQTVEPAPHRPGNMASRIAAKLAALESTAATNDEVVDMFISDSFPKDKMPSWGTPNLKISKQHDGSWALVNYSTPILYRNKQGELFFNTQKYSPTTSKIQNSMKKSLEGTSVTETDEDGIKAAMNNTTEAGLGYVTENSLTSRESRLRKKAARLGNYDFDVHGGANWKLEACDDGKQTIKKVNKES